MMNGAYTCKRILEYISPAKKKHCWQSVVYCYCIVGQVNSVDTEVEQLIIDIDEGRWSLKLFFVISCDM